MIECPSCNFQNTDDPCACENCGAALSGPDPTGDEPPFAYENTDRLFDERYLIAEKLCADTTSALYRAKDVVLNIPVTIRTLPTILGKDECRIDDLKTEAIKALALSHPNIISLREFEFDQPVKYLVAEYVNGESLDKIIAQNGPLEVEDMLNIFAQIATAVDYAHCRHVLHRNIKPANILITPDGTAKLGDFAVTGQIRELTTHTGPESGTESLYMAPEQFGPKTANRQSDIYSLAAVIYQCLCAPANLWRGWMEYQILKETPAPLTALADEQNAALLKALSRDPENRQTSARELLAALGAPPPSADATAGPENAPKKAEPHEGRIQPESHTKNETETPQTSTLEDQTRIEPERTTKTQARPKPKLTGAISKIRIFVLISALAIPTIAAILAAPEYLEHRKTLRAASKSWENAKLFAERQDYRRALAAAEYLITDFPEYAKKQRISQFKNAWTQYLAEQGLWLEIKRLADRSKYEAAVSKAAEFSNKYPDSSYARDLDIQVSLWRKKLIGDIQIDAFLNIAKKAADADNFDFAREAVISVFELDPDNAKARALKTQIEAHNKPQNRLPR